jgi:hypothetical protein
VKERLAPYKYPRFLEFVSELPKTATEDSEDARAGKRGMSAFLSPFGGIAVTHAPLTREKQA